MRYTLQCHPIATRQHLRNVSLRYLELSNILPVDSCGGKYGVEELPANLLYRTSSRYKTIVRDRCMYHDMDIRSIYYGGDDISFIELFVDR